MAKQALAVPKASSIDFDPTPLTTSTPITNADPTLTPCYCIKISHAAPSSIYKYTPTRLLYMESKTIATSEKFVKFGLTDYGILNLARDKYLVLTDDFKLANYLQSVGIDTINFNNIRTWRWY